MADKCDSSEATEPERTQTARMSVHCRGALEAKYRSFFSLSFLIYDKDKQNQNAPYNTWTPSVAAVRAFCIFLNNVIVYSDIPTCMYTRRAFV